MAQKKEYLSKNQKIVLDIIEKSAQPMNCLLYTSDAADEV